MNKRAYIVSSFIFLIGGVLYWSTAYPSITWWETAEYAGAAVGLGISGPPGSLFLTIAGWLLSKLPSHDPAFLFNLFAGVVGSIAVTFCYTAFRRVETSFSEQANEVASFPDDLIMAIGSGMILAGSTLWEYSIMFAPYVLTGLFTTLILLSILKWWERSEKEDSWKQLFIIALLFGLDFSVHRTNAILMPGVLLIVLIRKPKSFLIYRSYLAAISGLILGISVQLLYIPISRADPSMNMGQPNNLAGLWYYFSLKQYGGSFLLDILTRKSPLISYQIPYYLKGFANNFFYFDHKTIILGFIPGLLGLTGIFSLFKRNRKLAVSLFLFLIISIFVSIIYFNLPANYFRSIYRHYLPTFIIFSVFIFFGLEYVLSLIRKTRHVKRWSLYSVLIVLECSVFFNQYLHNIRKNNGAGNNFATEYAGNIIKSIDKGGIVFSYGDNDYFPVIYAQEALKLRPDIIHLNLSLLNADWYVKSALRHDKDLPYKGDGIDLSKFIFGDWIPQNISIPLTDVSRKIYNTDIDSVKLTFPAIRSANSNWLQDVILFDIIKYNRWERPIYFIKSAVDSELFKWISPYLRDEGLVYQFVPDTLNKVNYKAITANIARYDLKGYADSTIMLDDMSADIGRRYYDIFLKAARYKAENKDMKGVSDYIDEMKKLLPFNRLSPGKEIIENTNKLETIIVR